MALAGAVTSLGFFPLKNEDRNIFDFIALLGRLSSTYLFNTYYCAPTVSGTVLGSGDITTIKQSPNLQGENLLLVTENNKNCSLCQVIKKTMQMQQAGAWKDRGAIFNRVVREDLLEEGMRK